MYADLREIKLDKPVEKGTTLVIDTLKYHVIDVPRKDGLDYIHKLDCSILPIYFEGEKVTVLDKITNKALKIK